MKKTINIKGTTEDFRLVCDGQEILTIPKNNLTVDGKKLFDTFISKLDLSSKIEFDYEDDLSITDSNDKRVITDLKNVLNTIAQKINDKFKLLTDDVDAFLQDDTIVSTNKTE